MTFRWYTYKLGDFMAKWKFASMDEIREESKLYPQDFFVSVEAYDQNGENKHCPIYIDLDGEKALGDARYIMSVIKNANIYFSGSKGFHIILPYRVDGEICEKYIKEWLLERFDSLESWDRGIYKTRGMFRSTNSINSKSGLYKIPLSTRELMTLTLEEIKLLAQTKRYKRFGNKVKSTNEYAKEFAIIKERLDESSTCEYKYEEIPLSDWKGLAAPCVLSAISTRPLDGEWHYTLFALGRFFKSCSIKKEEAVAILLEQEHYSEDREYVRKTIDSAYRWISNRRFGTHGTVIAKFCIPNICRFNRRNKV